MEYQAGARCRMELMRENASVKQLLVAAVRQNRELATGLKQVTAFQSAGIWKVNDENSRIRIRIH